MQWRMCLVFHPFDEMFTSFEAYNNIREKGPIFAAPGMAKAVGQVPPPCFTLTL